MNHEKQLPEQGAADEKGREVLLRVEGLDVTFGDFYAVQDATFQIFRGETLSLVGESGSGKTTIGRAIIGACQTSGGEMLYKGTDIRKPGKVLQRQLRRQIQMVFQDPAASLNERATVEDILSEGLRNFRLYDSEEHRREKVRRIMDEVGLLPEHLSRYPHEFSGGQRQRIGIARAMVMEPELVIADEPISALDVSIRAQVLNLMKKLQLNHGTTFLFIAHDLSVVRHISDRIAVIRRGRIVEVAGAEELFTHPMHPYTKSLMSAVPIPDPRLEREKKLISYDPSIHIDSGEARLEEICPGHMVYGTPRELEAYRAFREEGIPLPEDLYQKPRVSAPPVAVRRKGIPVRILLASAKLLAGVVGAYLLALLLAVL